MLPTFDVCIRQLLHKRQPVPIVFRPHDEVPMIGHQTIRADTHAVDSKSFIDDPFKCQLIGRLFKQRPATNSPIQYMKNHSTR
jgi:hypothetical protein